MENDTTPPRTGKEPSSKGSPLHKRRFFAGKTKHDALEGLNVTTLGATPRAVFAVILRHSRDGKPSFPNQARLAFETGRSVRTVQSAVRELVEAGLVEKFHRREIDGKKFKYGRAYRINWALLWDCYTMWLRHQHDWEALAQSDEVRDLAREAASACRGRNAAECIGAPSAILAECTSPTMAISTLSPAPETVFRDAPVDVQCPIVEIVEQLPIVEERPIIEIVEELPTVEALPAPTPPKAETTQTPEPAQPSLTSRERGTSPRALGTNKRAEMARAAEDRRRTREQRRAARQEQILSGPQASAGLRDILRAVTSRNQPEQNSTSVEQHSLDSPGLPGLHKVVESPRLEAATGTS